MKIMQKTICDIGNFGEEIIIGTLIECKICGLKLKHLCSHLLYKHHMIGKDYKEKFPNAELWSKASKQKVGTRAQLQLKNLEYKKRWTKIISKAAKKSWKENYIERSNSIKAVRSTKESRLKTHNQMITRWQNEEWRKQFSKLMKAHWADPEYKEMVIKKWQSQLVNHYKDTNIEIMMENIFIEKGIKYEKQKFICGYPVDFYLPDFNAVIECDGDYWHSSERVKEIDDRKNQMLINAGFKVFRFLGSDIMKSAEQCANTILQ